MTDISVTIPHEPRPDAALTLTSDRYIGQTGNEAALARETTDISVRPAIFRRIHHERRVAGRFDDLSPVPTHEPHTDARLTLTGGR
jgi:hypothetical protein